MPRLLLRLLFAGLLLPVVMTACGGRDPADGPPTAPTSSVDTTRTEGPPLTYEEIERGLVGRWVADTTVTDLQASTEWNFFPDRTWQTPTLRGYGGRYELTSAESMQMHSENGSAALFRFQLKGDELILRYVNETDQMGPPMRYTRLSATPGAPKAAAPTATGPAGAGTSPAGAATSPAGTDTAATGLDAPGGAADATSGPVTATPGG